MTESPQIEVHLTAGDLAAALENDVRAGLGSRPRELPAKWFYDERGCALFDEITRLPEYYPTRREREILLREADAIVRASTADTLVELGSGTSEKTRILLGAMSGAGLLDRIVLFDVSEPTIRSAAAALSEEYPGVEVSGVVGDFERHLHLLPSGGRRLIAFLGGTIGNLGPVERKWFLGELANGMAPGDSLLLGTDLVKDAARLEAAYDDAAGVTAAFNLNMLVMLNRVLGADFDVAQFAHEARFDREKEWMDIRLRASSPQSVDIADLGMKLELECGESIRTEISSKFRRSVVEADLATAGLDMTRWWTDAAGDYAVSLSVPAAR
ncbi:MAG TPA: L-histidine N(alpha)-methyltransferase [Acidimicrobiales bacterium]|nr:L-histidine N(alpha)-methyltransferase [Acidimicrobiales bacterium]